MPSPPPVPALSLGFWTTLSPSADTRDVFVSSSSGLDENDGLAAERPKRTLRAAIDLLRDGFPDWLHIRRGDEFGSIDEWNLSGRSATEPMVVTTYGPDQRRPIFRCGSGSGLTVHSASIHDVAFVGLHLLADTYSGAPTEPYGISVLAPSARLLFEDCRIERFFTNIRFQGAHSDLRLRRSVIVDAFTTGAGHAQGIYVDGVDDCTIEECVFDHNGWREEVAGAVASIYRHNLYIQGNTSRVAIVGNIIARAGSHGLQARSGGAVRNNLFFGNPINLLVGNDIQNSGAVEATVIGNVIMASRDIDGQQRRGWAAQFQCLAGGEIAYNVAAHQVGGTAPRSFTLDSTLGVGVMRVDFHHNIAYRWGAPLLLVGDRFTGLVLRGNDLQEPGFSELLRADRPLEASDLASVGNRLFSGASEAQWIFYDGRHMSLAEWRGAVADDTSSAVQVAYPRPEVTLREYDLATGGGGSIESFFARARAQSRTNWDPMLVGANVAAQFRANFAVTIPH